MTDAAYPTWAELLPADRPALMGILNATPDSFSDGGRFRAPKDAVARAADLADEGADIIDVGGESTRPGAEPVPLEEELDRVMPVLTWLSEPGPITSIDTRKTEVMRAAVRFGGTVIVNDVSALMRDPEAVDFVAAARVPVILMHMQGEPATMNDDPRYDDVVAEVAAWLAARADACIEAGISSERIAVDPGLGFGKTYRHNLALLHGLEAIVALGYPVCVGASRKLAAWTAADSVRLAVSTTAAVVAAQKGAAILRVHDVAETRAALRVAGVAPIGRG